MIKLKKKKTFYNCVVFFFKQEIHNCEALFHSKILSYQPPENMTLLLLQKYDIHRQLPIKFLNIGGVWIVWVVEEPINCIICRPTIIQLIYSVEHLLYSLTICCKFQVLYCIHFDSVFIDRCYHITGIITYLSNYIQYAYIIKITLEDNYEI